MQQNQKHEIVKLFKLEFVVYGHAVNIVDFFVQFDELGRIVGRNDRQTNLKLL